MLSVKSCVGVLFFLSLLVGGILGFIVMEGITIKPTITVTPEVVSTSSHEDTILILGVDSLERADPGLEGVWLVTLPDDPEQNSENIHLHVITLYPVTQLTVRSPETLRLTEPHTRIVIDPNDPFSNDILVNISLDSTNWPDIIIMDEYLVNMVLLLGNNLNPKGPIPPPSDNLFTKTWQDPSGAFEQQQNILTTLCDNPAPLSQHHIIKMIETIEFSHIQVKLHDDRDLMGLWQTVSFTQGKDATCDLYPLYP